MFALKKLGLGWGARRSPRSLVFVHIPKTAGTTFQTILSGVYRGAATCPVYPGWEAVRPEILARSWGSKLALVGGHFPYGLHADPDMKSLLHKKINYITFLRDPVARVVSHFNHVMYAGDPAHAEIVAEYPTIEKFIDHPWARNVQTNFLLGFGLQFDDDPATAIRDAAAVLRSRFKVVGLSERFDESLILCAEAFGWELPTHTPANRAVDRARALRVEDLDESVVARIRAANRCDIALYEYAQSLFDKRVARVPHFQAKLDRHRARLQPAAAAA